jgi:ubiquinone/menaquinone biosynthesis C-methylase UbiE
VGSSRAIVSAPGNLPSQAFRDRAGEAWVRLQERTDALIDPLGRVAIERLGPAPGARVLDVGCGCGQTLLELAELVGPEGRVVGIDVSEPMLGRARELTAGRPQIELLLADAQTHALPPASFDAIYSRFGVMFFDDARAAFANLRAAAKPGAPLAFVCWQELERNPWASLPLAAVRARLPEVALPEMLQRGRPGPFYFADRALVRAVLEGAGFRDVAFEPVERPLHLGGAMTLDEAVDYCRQIGPAARTIAEAPEALRPTLEGALATSLAPFVGPRGVWIDGAALVVTARAATGE